MAELVVWWFLSWLIRFDAGECRPVLYTESVYERPATLYPTRAVCLRAKEIGREF